MPRLALVESELTRGLHDPEVQRGRLITLYHLPQGGLDRWEGVSTMPQRLQDVVGIASKALNMFQHWRIEAWFNCIGAEPLVTEKDLLDVGVVMRSDGPSPMTAPWLGHPKLKLQDVFDPLVKPFVTIRPDLRLSYGKWLTFPFPNHPFPNYPEDTAPIRQVSLRSFPLFKNKGDYRIIGDDPTRFRFGVTCISEDLQIVQREFVSEALSMFEEVKRRGNSGIISK